MHSILCFGSMCLLSACSAFYAPTERHYASMGNDVGSHSLELRADGRFAIECHFFEFEDTPASTSLFEGDYQELLWNYRLDFNPRYTQDGTKKTLTHETLSRMFHMHDVIADDAEGTEPVYLPKDLLATSGSDPMTSLFVCNTRLQRVSNPS